MPIGTPKTTAGAIGDVINTEVTAKKTVRFATDAPLDANAYDNGVDGVGATIIADANGIMPDVDGVTPVVDDRLLVKDEVAGLKNGFYLVTSIGSAGTKWILTRTTDADENVEIGLNVNSFISEGAANADTLITLTNDGAVTIGTTALVFNFVIPSTTDDLPEGALNLYYTNARADGRIAAAVGVSVQAFSADNAFRTDKLSVFAATTSLELKGVISDETGSGALVFANSPTFVTPALGTPASGIATNLTGTAVGLTSGRATNIVGGLGGQIPYQSAVNTTALLANGTAGQVLQSNGTTVAPSWVTPAAASGDGMYDGSGTIPTTTIATVTDTLNFATGKVGIGITPTAALHPHVATTAGAVFIFRATSGATTPFEIRDDGYINAATDGGATFGTRSAGVIAKHSFTAGKDNKATNVSAIACSFALGIDNTVSGLFAGALGSTNISSGRSSLAINEGNTAGGDKSFSGGAGSVASGLISFAWGRRNVTSSANYGMSFGQDINNAGVSAFVLGAGADGTTGRLANVGNLELVVGFDTDIPTLYVSTASGVGTIGNVGIGISSFGTNAKGVFAIGTGVAPTTSKTDMFQMYSADHNGAVTAAPHFRNEEGDVVILFKGAALTGEDATATDGTIGTNDTITNNIRTRLGEVEARLQASGQIT